MKTYCGGLRITDKPASSLCTIAAECENGCCGVSAAGDTADEGWHAGGGGEWWVVGCRSLVDRSYIASRLRYQLFTAAATTTTSIPFSHILASVVVLHDTNTIPFDPRISRHIVGDSRTVKSDSLLTIHLTLTTSLSSDLRCYSPLLAQHTQSNTHQCSL